MILTDTIEIDAPVSTLWDLTLDVETWPSIMPTMTTVELLDPAPLAVGSRARIKQPAQRARVWAVSELTVDGAQRRFVWSAPMGPMALTARHVVDTTPTGCRNRLEIEITGRFSGLFGRLGRRALSRTLRTENECFKREAEARSA